ncbi:MAG: SUMF1/EgtB/PvdO family nonheme iron enzyme, partial [Chloroflexi bacterium]|nr:SUMF1/EgtB/PvdO family nonheme iron enzyme [Chloroflexota bacterium]
MRNLLLIIILSSLISTIFAGCNLQNTQLPSNSTQSLMVLIHEGEFEMGDHYGYVDPSHPSDETPIHIVSLSPFYIGKMDITVQQYCDYFNSALSDGLVSIAGGLVYIANGKDILFQTRQIDQYSRIEWDSSKFSVLDNRGNHPVTSVT